MGTTLLGSAKLSKPEGYPAEIIYNGKNLVFGRSPYSKDKFFGSPPSRHFVTVAPTRSGKGACLIIPNLVTYTGSVIVIDPKGENAYITAERRRKMGQKTYILDPWDEVNRRYGSRTKIKEKVATFNPLSILNPESAHFAEDVAYIADSLIISQGKDPHWDDSARELVAGLIAFAVQKHGKKANLPMIRDWLTKAGVQIAGIATVAQNEMGGTLAAHKLIRFQDKESKEIQSIISTALTQLAFLDSDTLAENLATSSFSFNELVVDPEQRMKQRDMLEKAYSTAKEKANKEDGQRIIDHSTKLAEAIPQRNTTIYLVLPVDKMQTFGRWLRLMVSIGIRTVSRNNKKINQPILFMLDEFGTIGKLSAVSQAVGLMAGMKMCIWVFVQDLSQLKYDYRDQWETFISNADAMTSFNVMDQFTAEYLSRMMGVSTVERVSEATAQTRRGLLGIGGKPDYMKMTDQELSRPLMHPDEIRRTATYIGHVIGRDDPFLFAKTFYHECEHLFKYCRRDPNFSEFKHKEPIVWEREQGVLPFFIRLFKLLIWPFTFTYKATGEMASWLVIESIKAVIKYKEIRAQKAAPKTNFRKHILDFSNLDIKKKVLHIVHFFNVWHWLKVWYKRPIR